MSATDDLVTANASAPWTPIDDARPQQRTAIVTCMDARIDTAAVFGTSPGEVHVLRNAGGVVTDDVERSLAVSQRALGTTEVLVVHHTRCGMSGDPAEKAAGLPPAPFDWGFFADVEEDVRAGVARLRASQLLLHTDAIRGFVLDIGTGRLAEVR